MKKIIISEKKLMSIIEDMINEVGDLHKNHKFGKKDKYCVILVNKEELSQYKKAVNGFMDSLDLDEVLKPKKYFISQYYDGSCCFVSKYNQQGEKVKPVTFSSEEEAQKEIDFMVKHSPKIMNKFIHKIVNYNYNEWK
jgi:hypothetical protein